MFFPISQLDVDGKIMITGRMLSFFLSKGYIDISVQKASAPGFPGCVENSAMTWHTIQSVKSRRKDMPVILLDLANVHGSVPHSLIKYSLDELFSAPKIQYNLTLCSTMRLS